MEIILNYRQDTKDFYTKIADKWINKFTSLELPKKCAFTQEKLQIPVRNKECKKVKCVYNLQSINCLLEFERNERQINYIQCLICGEQILKENLFFDGELAYISESNESWRLKKVENSQNEKYSIETDKGKKLQKGKLVSDLDEKEYEQVENDQNQALLKILALNTIKLRLETLDQLSKSNILQLKKFGEEKLREEEEEINKLYKNNK